LQINNDVPEIGQHQTPPGMDLAAPSRSSSQGSETPTSDEALSSGGDFSAEELRFMRLLDRCLPAALSNAFQSDIFRSMLTAVVKEEMVKVKEEISEVKEEISSKIKKELDERENTGRK